MTMPLEVTFSTNDPAKLGQIIMSATELGLTLVRVKGRDNRATAPDAADMADEEPEEGADTLLFPAKPRRNGLFPSEQRMAKDSTSAGSQAKIQDGTIKYIAAYEAAPGPQAVRWIAEIKKDGLMPSPKKPDKWRIDFENKQQILEPIPFGGVNIRSVRFISMAKLRKARTLADLERQKL